jgi:uncharacterized protein YjbJ (UPF0337 family)
MNRDRFYGICRQAYGKATQWWGKLIHDPSVAAAGARDQLAGRLQEQRGISKQEADQQLEDFLNRNRKWLDLSGH